VKYWLRSQCIQRPLSPAGRSHDCRVMAGKSSRKFMVGGWVGASVGSGVLVAPIGPGVADGAGVGLAEMVALATTPPTIGKLMVLPSVVAVGNRSAGVGVSGDSGMGGRVGNTVGVVSPCAMGVAIPSSGVVSVAVVSGLGSWGEGVAVHPAIVSRMSHPSMRIRSVKTFSFHGNSFLETRDACGVFL
jgi:hypothetical protein